MTVTINGLPPSPTQQADFKAAFNIGDGGGGVTPSDVSALISAQTGIPGGSATYESAANALAVANAKATLLDAVAAAQAAIPASLLSAAQVNILPVGVGRVATVVVAASDSKLKTGADLVCTGTADDAQITSLLSTYPAGPMQVLFRAGTYQMTSEIVVDRDHITLQGESYAKWHRYLNNADLYTFPRSAPGQPGGALFKQNTAGKGAFRIGTAGFVPSDDRHKNINFVRLSMYSASPTGTAIYDLNISDICRIEGCFISGFGDAINVAWDNPLIFNNNIQDTGNGSNGAITCTGWRGLIYGNTIFQVGGNGIACGSNGAAIFGNIIGWPNGNGILLFNQTIKVTGNQIIGIGKGASSSSDGIVIGNYAQTNTAQTCKLVSKAFGCVISGNTIQYTFDDLTTFNPGSGSGCGIRVGQDGGNSGLGSACDYTVISGNFISNAGNSGVSTGFGIKLQNGSNFCSVTGNVVKGNAWNSGGTSKIDMGSGANNASAGNVGQ
jgi:hypothetical protein